MNRTNIIAGNWKMNMTLDEGKALATEIVKQATDNGVKAIIAPPYYLLESVRQIIGNSKHVFLAAQNCHQEAAGAYTGEISVNMLKSVGVDYIIIGHSERRNYFDETNKMLTKKVNLALQAGLDVIFCCGESLTIREDNAHVQHVKRQLRESLFHLYENEFSRIVIAYEPIWAIGTGEVATPLQAQEMHAEIRKIVSNNYDDRIAQATTILYGGSCKPSNAEALFAKPDVDGGLIGGASLKAEDFLKLLEMRAAK